MVEIHYGVVRLGGVWTIIGKALRFGHFRSKAAAERAARRLASLSAGLPVQLHIQDETGQLQPPLKLD